MKRLIFISLLLLFTVIWGKALSTDIDRFEKCVQAAYVKAYPSAVKLIMLDSLGNDGGTGSGVVVSSDGLVLTVGHVVNTPGKRFRVVFPDGHKVAGRGLGSISSLDAGMIQIEEEGPFPFAPVGRSAGLQKGQPCIALGYAGGLKIEDPALRLGFVVSGDDPAARRRRIHTTCLMEPGDSGGPVFDLDGRVIGLRTSINQPLNANFEVPIDVYLEYWDFLLSGQTGRRPPENKKISLAEAPITNPDNSFIAFNDTTAVLQKYASALPQTSYTVTSTMGDSMVNAACTPLRMDGILSRKALHRKSYLLGKSSIIGSDPTIEIRGKKTVKAQVVYRDAARDLALLEIPARLKDGLVDLSAGIEQLEYSQVGTFLYSVLPDGNYRVSVAGAAPFTIGNRSRSAYLGAGIRQDSTGIYLTMVSERSPAETAGLAAGQKLVSMDGIEFSSTDEFVASIRSKHPGDSIRLEYMMDDEVEVKRIILANRPVVEGNHIAERFDGGKSVIRDGFDHVFVHDARVRPQECGSPVVDSEGRFYGINIARVSRTATLVMPVEEIKAFLQDFLAK